MSTRAPLVLALLLLPQLIGAGNSRADSPPPPVFSDEHKFTLTPPPGLVVNKEGPALRSYAGSKGLVMSVSRIDYSNLPAWWKGEKQTFFAQVESGLARTTRGYKRLKQTSHRLDGTPALDISFTRDSDEGREKVWMRFLFHRRFGIVASAASPVRGKRSTQHQGRDFTRSLRPWPRPKL